LAYRFGFNTQEKDDEVYGAGNLMSAKFWEMDARIGRRWNIDPVIKVWESPYLVNSGNPILFSDKDGDDTYIYNQSGILKEVILDKLTSNEIVFMKDKAIDNMMKFSKTHTADETAKAAREPHNNIGRITSKGIKLLTEQWTSSKGEKGGYLYKTSNDNNEIRSTNCGNCGKEKTKFRGELDVDKMETHANKLTEIGLPLIGYWHSHPENTVSATQPSFGYDDKIGKQVKQLENGGIGIIVNKNSITIYPLYGKDNNVTGHPLQDGNNNKTNLFEQPYTEDHGGGNSTSGTKSYPSFNQDVKPVK
jgi:hypothetical protein